MALQPLTQSDSLRVVQAVLPPAAQTLPLVPLVLAKAEGNPFFLEELARAVVEQGVDVASLTVPDTVQAVLTARMDRLPTAAKRLLQAAAVIGKEVALPLLQAVTEASAEALQGGPAVPAGRGVSLRDLCPYHPGLHLHACAHPRGGVSLAGAACTATLPYALPTCSRPSFRRASRRSPRCWPGTTPKRVWQRRRFPTGSAPGSRRSSTGLTGKRCST